MPWPSLSCRHTFSADISPSRRTFLRVVVMEFPEHGETTKREKNEKSAVCRWGCTQTIHFSTTLLATRSASHLPCKHSYQKQSSNPKRESSRIAVYILEFEYIQFKFKITYLSWFTRTLFPSNIVGGQSAVMGLSHRGYFIGGPQGSLTNCKLARPWACENVVMIVAFSNFRLIKTKTLLQRSSTYFLIAILSY